jgi:tetratricopeptide (TPR) repeat protein
VEALYRNKPIDVLFVQGIEHSLYDYEKNRLWSDNAQRRSYSETGVPRLLQHLNLSRERFYEDFAFHFVFLVPHFVLKYLTRRAPDFFDWRSGVLEFAMDREQLHQDLKRARIEQWNKENPWDFTPDECCKYLLEIQSLIEEPHQTEERKADLFFEQGLLSEMLGEYEAATASYDASIASYDKAFPFNLDVDFNFNRGNALSDLGRYEEAITSYDKALQLEPDRDSAWYNRGNALGDLGRYEEAIASYDKALQFKPDNDSAWYNRGIALGRLGRYEEAIASYEKALQFNSTKHEAFYNIARSYALQANTEAAIVNLNRAIALNPDKYRDMAKTDSDFDSIRQDERFQSLVNEN